MAKFRDYYAAHDLKIHDLRENEFAVTEIPFVLPLHGLGAFHWAYEAHLSYPLAHSDDAGEFWKFLRDPVSFSVLIFGGKVQIDHTDLDGNTWLAGEQRPVEPDKPLFVRGDKPIMPKSKMRLKMLLPYLDEIAHVAAISTSSNDGRHVRDLLTGLDEMCRAARRHLLGAPLILRRELREYTQNRPDGAFRSEDWFYSIDPAPDLAAELLQAITAPHMVE